MPNNLHDVLANMGVPSEALRASLPAEGPRAAALRPAGHLTSRSCRAKLC